MMAKISGNKTGKNGTMGVVGGGLWSRNGAEYKLATSNMGDAAFQNITNMVRVEMNHNLRQNIPALSSFIIIIVVIIQKRERERGRGISSSKQSHIYVICTKQLRWEREMGQQIRRWSAVHAINQNREKTIYKRTAETVIPQTT